MQENMVLNRLRKGLKRIQILSKTAHKPYVAILCEVFYWRFVLNEQIGLYLNYELFLRGKRIKGYVGASQFKRIARRLNTPEYYPILEDKYFFSKVLEGNGFRSPKNLFLLDPSGIFNLESSKYINEEEFLQKDLDGFCKLINGFGGKMISQVEIVNQNLRINKKDASVSELLKNIGHRKFLIQERIIQHEEMNVLNPSCMNTMRMLTIKTGQTIHFYQDFLRIGINNSIVDNSYIGNILIGIQRKDGRLMEYAYSSGMDGPQYKLDRHPQTNIAFKNFSIPFYSESVEMVKSMHLLFQQFFMIGWDIGITPDGPIVIEGNNITTLFPFQVLYGGLESSFIELAESYERYL